MANPQPDSNTKRAFLVSIDIGTTHSGAAMSTEDQWQSVGIHLWQEGIYKSHKIPSTLLLNPDGSFLAFGYDAEEQYTDLSESDMDDYYYFNKFKLALHQEWDKKKRVARNTMIKEERGKSLEAMTVFSMAIRFLKEHILDRMKRPKHADTHEDICFVLTVPTIWDHTARAFMREAGVKAGIPNTQLLLVSESEAASMYCQHMPNEGLSSEYVGNLRIGEMFMVLDCGANTKVTIHRKCEDGTLEEVHPGSIIPWGGKSIDDAFENFLQDIVGEKVMKKFKQNALEDKIELLRNFELHKQSVNPEKLKGRIVKITVPDTFTDLMKGGKAGFVKAIQESKYSKFVSFGNGKLKWKTEDFVRILFDDTINAIVKHVVAFFNDENVKNVKIIMMVGGFSGCKLFQIAIAKTLLDKKFVVLLECGLAVLKGAIYSAHILNSNSHFTTTYTYGVKSWPVWKEMIHPIEKRVKIGEKVRCRDGFFKFVQKGQCIKPGFKRSQIFVIPLTAQTATEVECAIVLSERKYPILTDEPKCRTLGVLKLDLVNITTRFSVELEETMIFEETKIRFQVRNVVIDQIQEVSFDVLNDIHDE